MGICVVLFHELLFLLFVGEPASKTGLRKWLYMHGWWSKLSRRKGSKSLRWRRHHKTRRSSIPRWDRKWFNFFYFGYVRFCFSFDLFSGEFNLIMAREGRYFCEWLRSS